MGGQSFPFPHSPLQKLGANGTPIIRRKFSRWALDIYIYIKIQFEYIGSGTSKNKQSKQVYSMFGVP